MKFVEIYASLTDAEISIIELTLREEMTPEEIARYKCQSIRTVQYHIASIIAKYKTPSFLIAVIAYTKERYLDKEKFQKKYPK